MRKLPRFSVFSAAFMMTLALSFLVFSLASFQQARANLSASSGDSWAIVIGISNYATANDLRYCDDDAVSLSSQLASTWGASHVKLLTDSAANKTDIHDAIFNWLAPLEDADDTVLFFFSGHGSRGSDLSPLDEPDGYDEYICPHNSMTGFVNMIRDDELDSWLGILDSKKTVVILDTCFSGGFISGKWMSESGIIKTIAAQTAAKSNSFNDDFAKDLSKSGRVILTACNASEESAEDGRIKHGVFSYFVTEALGKQAKAADANMNSEISAEEVYNYSKQLTTTFAASLGCPQHPQIYDSYDGELPLVTTVAVTFDNNPRKTSFTIDGTIYSRLQLPLQFTWVTNTSHNVAVNPTEVAHENLVESVNVESPHPYPNNYTNAWTLTRANASRMRVHFSYINIEVYDHIYVGNAATDLATYAGYYVDYWSTWVSGDTVKIRMTSDNSIVYDGFKIDSLEIEQNTPNAQYRFSTWNDGYTSVTRTLMATSSQTYTATYKGEYYLSVISAYGTAIGASWYENGTSARPGLISGTVSYSNGTRRAFTNWSGDGTGTNFSACDPINMSSPKTVTANWVTQYYLTTTSQYGTVNGSGWYDSGANANVVLVNGTVSIGGTQYVFMNWTGDASGTTLTSSNITMNNPKTATANWKTQYYLNVTSAYGNVSGSGWYDRNALASANVSQTTVPDATGVQYVFTSWSGSATGTGASLNSVLMDYAKSVTANWKTQYQVSFTSNPSSVGTISPSAATWVDAGGNPISISASASSSYSFTSWSATPGINIANPQTSGTTATVTAPGTITANFIAVPTSSSPSSSSSSSDSSQTQSPPSSSSTSQTQAKIGNLIVCVKDSNNNPIEGVTIVTTSQPEGQTVLSATTNSSGYVTFINVIAGSYSLQASKNGYIMDIVQTTAQTDKATPVTMELQNETVSPPSSQPVEFWPVIAAISTLVVCSAVVIFFLRRKKN